MRLFATICAAIVVAQLIRPFILAAWSVVTQGFPYGTEQTAAARLKCFFDLARMCY
jgi:hypothetical protein